MLIRMCAEKSFITPHPSQKFQGFEAITIQAVLEKPPPIRPY